MRTNIRTLNGRDTNLQAYITENRTTDISQSTDLTNANSSINSLNNDISTTNNNISTLKTTVNNNNTTLVRSRLMYFHRIIINIESSLHSRKKSPLEELEVWQWKQSLKSGKFKLETDF